MNIDHLRDFLRATETLNLTIAAEQRNTTQSNLSKRLRALEEYLGRILFNRDVRPLSLTAAGEEFVPVAKQILSEIDLFRGGSAPWSPSEGGITIVMPHSATVAIFPQFKAWLSQRLPGAHFAPKIANHDMAARMLARSEVDLAIVTRHPRVPIDDGFTAFLPANIAVDRLVIVEPSDAQEAVMPLHVSHPLTYIGQIWDTCRVALPVTVEVAHGMAADIRAQSLAGGGRGVLPESLVEVDVAAGRLAVRPTTADLEYTLSLFCSPQASRRARRIFSLAFANRELR